MTMPVPSMPSSAPQRLQVAVTRRNDTDYIFDFWTALGWTILTCGIFSLYVVYRLMWRSVEHNKRRLEVLDAATALGWERAVAVGREEELTPQFQRLGAHLDEMRRLTTEFRDPVIWTIICAVSSGIGQIVAYVFLDMDLVSHEAAERAAEQELAGILSALGVPLALPPAGATKGRHNYVGRVIALLASCFIYSLWWLHDLMVEGNHNYRGDWEREDALWGAAAALAPPGE
ncbi:MAG: hypothetical protein ABWZ76_14290 [Acidimicrobiales bacterium]